MMASTRMDGFESGCSSKNQASSRTSCPSQKMKIIHETLGVFIHATSATSPPSTNLTRGSDGALRPSGGGGSGRGSSPLPDILPGKICITERSRDAQRFVQWFYVSDMAADEYQDNGPNSPTKSFSPAKSDSSDSSPSDGEIPAGKRWSVASVDETGDSAAMPSESTDPSWDVIEGVSSAPSLPPPIPPRQASSSSSTGQPPKAAPPSPSTNAAPPGARKFTSPPPLPARCSAATPASKSCANFQAASSAQQSDSGSGSSAGGSAGGSAAGSVSFTKNSLAVSFSGQNVQLQEAVRTNSLDEDDDVDDNAAMAKRGIPPSNDPAARRYERLINFEIDELKSFRRSPRNCSWSYLTLILADGTTLPALHFHDGGSSAFVANLEKYVVTRQSAADPRLFLVTSQEAEKNALIKSFDELNLFSDPVGSNNLMSKLVADPVTTTLGGFSRVTNFLRDLSAAAPKSAAVSRRHRDELLHDPFADLPNLMFTSPQDDPDYEIITRVQNDTASPNGPSSSGRGSASSASATPTHSSPWTSRRPSPGTIEELPPRPSVARGNPIVAKEWAKYLSEDGRVVNVESLKQQIFRGGVDPPLRIEVWKFLLGYYDYSSTYDGRKDQRTTRVDDYFRMKLQWKSLSPDQESRFSALKERKALIEKDVNRTDRTHAFFQGEKNPNLDVLSDVLMTYVMYNFDLGYVQGMSDLLAPVLVVMENEVDAFWCFVGFMELIGRNFEMDQSTMKQQMIQLHAIIEFVDPELMRYLENHDSGNLYFCFRWLLIHFKREFSFPDIMRLWEVLWTGHPCRNFHLLICVALLDTEKHVLVENEFGFTEILKHINDMSGTIDIDAILRKAEAIFIQIAGCRSPPRAVAEILGLEAMLCPTAPVVGQSPKIAAKVRENGSVGGGGHRPTNSTSSTATPKRRSPSPTGSSTPHSSIEVLTTQSDDDDEGMV